MKNSSNTWDQYQVQQSPLTESSDAEGNQRGEALVTGKLHQSSILCLTQVQQLGREETDAKGYIHQFGEVDLIYVADVINDISIVHTSV